MLRSIITIVTICGFGGFLHAAEGEHVCKSGQLERNVNIVELESGRKAPCEVRYTKEGGEEKVLYSAKADETYCSTKAHEFMAKLKELGWECPE